MVKLLCIRPSTPTFPTRLSFLAGKTNWWLQITVDGKQVLTRQSAQRFYFALNKPKGYICSTTAEEREDGSAPRLLLSLFDTWMTKTWRPQHANLNLQPPRLFSVGRLDAQSVGLIFITNDGASCAASQGLSGATCCFPKSFMVVNPASSAQLALASASCHDAWLTYISQGMALQVNQWVCIRKVFSCMCALSLISQAGHLLLTVCCVPAAANAWLYHWLLLPGSLAVGPGNAA